MQDLQHVFPRLRSYILYLLALYVLGWGFTSYKAVFAGLILGTALSLYNLWNLVRKFEQFGQALDEGKAPFNWDCCKICNSCSRSCDYHLLSKTFHIISVVVGLMTYYVVIIIDLVVQNMRRR